MTVYVHCHACCCTEYDELRDWNFLGWSFRTFRCILYALLLYYTFVFTQKIYVEAYKEAS